MTMAHPKTSPNHPRGGEAGSVEPLPPLPPLPPLQGTTCGIAAARKKRRSLLSWATVLAVMSAIGFGIIHGVGSKLVDEVWPIIRTMFGF